MKKVLLGTTALLGAGVFAGTAMADDGIKLEVGGYFREAYIFTMDDDGQQDGAREPGRGYSDDGFFNDSEVHFKGKISLDNGITVGVRMELEGETDSDQIDESYVFFSGDFGEFRFGADDEALAANCVIPPSSTANFGVFSPNQWGSNGSRSFALSSNTVCTGVDVRGDSQKVVYFSPSWGGFSFAVSYTPNSARERHTDGVGPHIGMPASSTRDTSVYLNYAYEGDGWGLSWGGGASWQLSRTHDQAGEGRGRKAAAYQTGLVLSFGGFSVGGAFEVFDDINSTRFNVLDADDNPVSKEAAHDDAWVAGGGISYNVDAWTVGLGYSHGSATHQIDNTNDDPQVTQDRVALTGNYNMGPGIDIDAYLAYTWYGTDDDYTIVNGDSHVLDDYTAFELGVGTAITF